MGRIEQLKEQTLVLRAQIGDARAFERLVEKYHERLYFYIYRLVGDRDRAEDVLQSVWLTVFQKLGALRAAEAFSTWLYRIARNHAFKLVRRENHYQTLEEDVPAENAEEDEEFRPEDAERIYRALDRLSPIHREVLTLRFLEGMVYDDIAGVVGCPVGTVRSRIFNAKRALRRMLEETGDER